MKDKIMVSVLCTAYNHEKFIENTIEGIIQQKTDFRYELIIHDDASSDNTALIIQSYAEKYPGIIRTILQKENQYQYCNIYKKFLFPEVKGQYIAFCEGDDFWIDKNKLQMQVELMEAHKEYSMCLHNAVKLNYETGEKILLNTFGEDGVYSQKEQILAGLGTEFPAFASYLLRANYLKDMPDFFLASKVLDYPLRQYYANCGKVYYFKKAMSVYRVSTPQSYMKKTLESQKFYNNYTLEMIRFFENFNQYTQNHFWTVLKNKVISDYFGFCLSIPENEGIRKASEHGLCVKRVRECYQKLSFQYIDDSIKQVYTKSEYLFIYGTSRIAPICKNQMESSGMEFEGFVVSDGQMKANCLEDKKIYYLSEVLKKYDNPGFVLAVQPINAIAVIEILEKKGIKNYCSPYVIRENGWED